MAVKFTEENIQRLFGHEAAEDEDPSRLREYYFKPRTYQQVSNDLPLRILVGHKGIGKSALFKIAQAEELQNHTLAISIQPNDLKGIASGDQSFLDLIYDWEQGLLSIIARKTLISFGIGEEDVSAGIKRFGGQLTDFLAQTFKDKLPPLQEAQDQVIRRFLVNRQITVYIDDLDRGWEGRPTDITRISALLNAVRDICNDMRGIRFRIALRSDVYFLVRTSDESTDKLESSVVWQSFDNHEILCLLVKRIETFFERETNEAELLAMPQKHLAGFLDSVMVQKFDGLGHWQNAPMYKIMMSLIRKRPRDLVKLCTLAARNAFLHESSLISTGHFENIFEEYSQGRIQDTINEFRSELPDIERLIMNMKPTKRERTAKEGYVYTTDTLTKKLNNIISNGEFRFANGRNASTKDLIHFLYKINFLTGRKEGVNGIQRRYFEENRYIHPGHADFGFAWEVHPAYRWALQPDDPRDIFRHLELTADVR